MRKLTTFAMALMMGMMMLVSCNKDKDNKDQAVFHATIESRTQDRTYLDPVNGQGQVKWMDGDQIRIYNGNGEDAVFTLTSGANTTDGTFTYAGEFKMVPPYLAVYPVTARYIDGRSTFRVSTEQHLTEPGTFANGENPMLAYGTDVNLYFQNLCGGLGIRLYGNAHVSSIAIMDVEGAKLNGQFMVEVEDAGLESYPYGKEGNNLVTLTCDVTLSPTDTTDFYAVLPVGVLCNGVLVEIYDGETKVGEIALPDSHAAQVMRNTIKSFQPVEVTVGGGDEHAYVDLGLPSGLLWATCNVGAETPEEYGDYFAWGETQPKDTYNWGTYQYCNGSNSTLTKYCNNPDMGYNGFTDNLTTLLPEDDAATANWGGEWRMPTKAEFEELYNNTTVTWTQQNGVNGRLFTAANGNSLFLPAAGSRYNSSLDLAGSDGYYWSSSLYAGSPSYAWHLDFYSGNYLVDYRNRNYGRSVRPVRSARQN